MKGFLIEYAGQGFPEMAIQLDVEAPNIDTDREVLTIWEFESAEECDQILADLRRFRELQLKGIA
jgi:hypothetical protein